MRTPLYFNEEEMNVLKGTNIYGATVDRERAWRAEHRALREELSAGGVIEGELLLWYVMSLVKSDCRQIDLVAGITFCISRQFSRRGRFHRR